MSQIDNLRARVLGGEPTSDRANACWIRPNDQVEVLWTSSDDEPHLTQGRFKGLRVPAAPEGGPVQFILDGLNGEVDIDAEDLVGITPVERLGRAGG